MSGPYREDREPCRECARREAGEGPWWKDVQARKTFFFTTTVVGVIFGLCHLGAAGFRHATYVAEHPAPVRCYIQGSGKACLYRDLPNHDDRLIICRDSVKEALDDAALMHCPVQP